MNKKILLIISAILLLIIVVVMFMRKSSSQKEQEVTVVPTPTKVLEKIEAQDVGDISLTPRYDKKAATLKIKRVSERIDTAEYEFQYETIDGKNQGVLGRIDLSTQKDILKEILLGTCSKNVCRYDTATKGILTIKFTGPDSFEKVFQKEYDFTGTSK